MSEQGTSTEGSAMQSQSTGSATPPGPPNEGSATPTHSQTPADQGTRDATLPGTLDSEGTRDANLTGPALEKALKEERKRSRQFEAELRTLREAEKARSDAEKTELERVSERAETAERRVAQMERESLARQVANEMGIPQLWHRLSGADVRALRADASKMREELGLGSGGGLEGGVRSDGVPAQPSSMDELIRGFGAARR